MAAFEDYPDASENLEKAILVAVQLPDMDDEATFDSIRELGSLARTAGAEVVSELIQKRNTYDTNTVIGSGKTGELSNLVRSHEADLVIFDNDLTVSQLGRLENEVDCKVVDRATLILDIFAQHAHTREGKTQVELAQLSYLLPRLRGKGLELSRMGGGIGTRRGPGETKLEVDRRRIRKRMRKLENDLSQMESVRVTQRKRRIKAGLPSICLVGYTNSGKSTLLNRLAGADVLVEDKLFSTLDSTTRRIKLPGGKAAVISDTVGFIKKLPHELIAAFHSTLEVVREADLILHIIEADDLDRVRDRIYSVESVLDELGASEIPQIRVFSKLDIADPSENKRLTSQFLDAVYVSAQTGDGVGALIDSIAKALPGAETHNLFIPVDDISVLTDIQSTGTILESSFHDDIIEITASIPPDTLNRYSKYMNKGKSGN